tara:strand:+ start:198 stop:1253 length:1056 start_codon:yes stop_codon:yes gene_type:complete
MIFLKRHIPLFIVIVVGLLTLFGHFVNSASIQEFVDNDSTQWFDIIAAFAIFLGALNMLKLQLIKIIYKKKNWQYSVIAVLGFFFAIFAGFFYKGANYINITDIPEDNYEMVSKVIYSKINKSSESAIYDKIINNPDSLNIDLVFISKNNAHRFMNESININNKEISLASMVKYRISEHPWGAHVNLKGSLFSWMFFTIFTPLSATMFALLAFFVASASYRAFRIRNFEATLLLVSGIILMLGRVPAGELIPWWIILTMLVFGFFALIAPFIKNKNVLFYSIISTMLISYILGYYLNWKELNILKITTLQNWIYSYPTTAGSRALMIGIALGIIGTSFRIIIGKEKSFLGE